MYKNRNWYLGVKIVYLQVFKILQIFNVIQNNVIIDVGKLDRELTFSTNYFQVERKSVYLQFQYKKVARNNKSEIFAYEVDKG